MATRKVRVKKLSVKTPLPVLREDQIEPSEYESLTSETQIATGVEQAEENEYHLQTILKEAGTSNDQEIPVPPPQPSEIKYDELYPSTFQQTASYIRFSQTVEECISCAYDMTTEDDDFLKKYSDKKGIPRLSEDDFERIMEVFEDMASETTPFASIDNTVVSYDMMVPSLNALGEAKLMLHAKPVYEYWKSRRQATGNKPLHPTLKFELHQDTDDADPYVCFRRREARQTRKTRQRDVQSADKLKKLRKELEDGRQLIINAYEREMLKRDSLLVERDIFEHRAKLKAMKIRLGIKNEDEDLINQKPQKRKPTDVPALQRPPSLRMPIRPDGRAMDADLVQLAEKLAEKENELRAEVELKVQTHRKWNQNHIDLTRDPLSPVKEQGMEVAFRPAKTQYLMTPPASTSSDDMDVDDETTAPEKQEMPVFRFTAGGAGASRDSVPSKLPAFRRRFGRLGRLWIDRRGMTTPPRSDEEYSDRWKYDQEDEDEPPEYDVDPFDTRALKFRATIPLSPLMFPRRQVAAEGMVATLAAQNAAAATAAARPGQPPAPKPGPPPAPQAQSVA